MSCQKCLDNNIPEHLCSIGKSDDIPFENEEFLYRRFKPSTIPYDLLKLDAEIISRIFSFKDDSYNRSKLSEPKDVLINSDGKIFEDHEILGVKYQDIHEKTFQGNSDNILKQFKLIAHFSPEDCNYAHTEIHVYVDDKPHKLDEPPKNVRKIFRQHLLKIISTIPKDAK